MTMHTHQWMNRMVPAKRGGIRGNTRIRACTSCEEIEAIFIPGRSREPGRILFPDDFYSPERLELIQRLNQRWRDNQDPGIPARLKAILR